MRILYFSFVELDVPNACQTHTLGVLLGFSHNGCQVDALVPKPKYVFPDIPNTRFRYLWPWQFSAAGRIWIKSLLLVRMISLCTSHRYDAIYVRELQNNPAPRWCSRLWRIPLYVEVNDLISVCLTKMGVKESTVRRAAANQKRDFEQASGIIVNSTPMMKWISNTYDSAVAKIHLVINGTELPPTPLPKRHIILERLQLPDDGFYLVFLGILSYRFSFKTVLHCMRSLTATIPGIRFVVVGDGPDLTKVKAQVEKLQMQTRVVFTGFINSLELQNYLPAFDIALIPLTKYATKTYGSFPTKFATYASFGLPVISTKSDLTGYPEEIQQGVFLVPPEDSQALASEIIHLYNNPEERNQKADILRDFVVQKLTWNSVTKEILDIMNYDNKLK